MARILLILLSFLLWGFLFRDFLAGRRPLLADAVPYLEHVKFYCDQITRGVYPFWDPTRDGGVPQEFFLRRMGEFNPFYDGIVILSWMGMPFVQAYCVFLGAYYLLAMAGFYLLAMRIWKEQRTAFAAFLLLLFSSLGTMPFISFLLLIFTPMVWFFYFCLAFAQDPRRSCFLGIIFTLMLLSVTYLPFYFLTILGWFLACWTALYLKEAAAVLKTYGRFIGRNKIFAACCFFALALALLPGLLFFVEGRHGQVVFPSRHVSADIPNTISVASQSVASGGIPFAALGSRLFSGLAEFEPGRLYLPIFFYVLLGLGLISPLNRRQVLFVLWGLGIYLISLYDAAPVYTFLYEHIFYFKFFKNFQFFLWLLILPLGILLAADHFDSFLKAQSNSRPSVLAGPLLRPGQARIIFVGILHAGLILFLNSQEGVLASSYINILCSFLFFAGLVYLEKIQRSVLFSIFLLGCVAVQPMEVYSYLAKNARRDFHGRQYLYQTPGYLRLSLPAAAAETGEPPPDFDVLADRRPPNFYAAAKWAASLLGNLNPRVFAYYPKSPLMVYDRVEFVEEENPDFRRIGDALVRNENTAFVTSRGAVKDALKANPYAQPIAQSSRMIEVEAFDANFLKLRTYFPTEKFLVYNDSYYPQWRVFIDGHEEKLVRANVAFKGVWVPAGEHLVHFRFGAWWRYALAYLLIGVFHAALGVLVLFFRASGTRTPEPQGA